MTENEKEVLVAIEHLKARNMSAKYIDMAIQALEEIQQYRAIGTIEEFKALKDKAEPKKVDEDDCCPICHTYGKDDNGVAGDYCPECGQALDWQ